MTRGAVAKKVRLEKERHPDRFCERRGCLWRLAHGMCPKHWSIHPKKEA